MLRDLLERCPNMITLELIQANISNVAIDNLPPGLTTLIYNSFSGNTRMVSSFSNKG